MWLDPINSRLLLSELIKLPKFPESDVAQGTNQLVYWILVSFFVPNELRYLGKLLSLLPQYIRIMKDKKGWVNFTQPGAGRKRKTFYAIKDRQWISSCPVLCTIKTSRYSFILSSKEDFTQSVSFFLRTSGFSILNLLIVIISNFNCSCSAGVNICITSEFRIKQTSCHLDKIQ